MIAQAEYRRLKTRLSRLENKLHRSVPNYCVPVFDEDDVRVPIYRDILKEVEYAFGIFEDDGYPDLWANWQRAADDASWQLGRFHPLYPEESF